MVFRYIKSDVQSFEGLNLPAKVLSKISLEKRGMILVTGATGSGKSTTIASVIEHINQNMPYHIVTLEDPIEFTFKDNKSVIEQRELGIDTPSYLEALKHIMYQSPDVIFIGNIRDQDLNHYPFDKYDTDHRACCEFLPAIPASGSKDTTIASLKGGYITAARAGCRRERQDPGM